MSKFLDWLYHNSGLLIGIFVLGLALYVVTSSHERNKLEILEQFANQGKRFTQAQGCELEARIEHLYDLLGKHYDRVLPRHTCENGGH